MSRGAMERCAAVRGLIRVVVGVGIAVFHSRTTVMPNPATFHHPDPPQSRKDSFSTRLPHSGLVQPDPDDDPDE